jgi:2'-5' RNA ligase
MVMVSVRAAERQPGWREEGAWVADARARAASLVEVQDSLPGIESAPPLRDGLFFAVFPDQDAARRIAQCARRLRAEHALADRQLRTERFHVTLHSLGRYATLPHDLIMLARQAAARVAMRPFAVEFNAAGSFPGSTLKPFVLLGDENVVALHSLRDKLDEALREVGLQSGKETSYTPHVTLLYDHPLIRPHAIEPVTWHVREFVLIHSLLGQTRHISLGRWLLQS